MHTFSLDDVGRIIENLPYSLDLGSRSCLGVATERWFLRVQESAIEGFLEVEIIQSCDYPGHGDEWWIKACRAEVSELATAIAQLIVVYPKSMY